MNLADHKCIPCRGGIPPMGRARAEELLRELDEGWRLNSAGHLERIYAFKNFAEALSFTNRVGATAEEEDHHPMLITEWGKVTVHWWTHIIKGLHKNDFIMAAKTDQLL